MDRPRIAVIIPALNEARTIGAVVARVREYGDAVVVDDGSTDDTARLAREAGAEVVSHAVNQGYDGALNSGFARAAELGYQYLITVDADGQHNPAQLREMIDYLDQGYQLVLGERDRLQRVGETIFAFFAARRWRIRDPLCGMKAYKVDLYRQAGSFDSFRSIGSELAVRSVVSGCRVASMAIITRDRVDAPRFGRRFAANWKILRAMMILMARYGRAPAGA